MKAARLDGLARVSFTDCLGPCSEANVVFVFLDGRPLWLRRMNVETLFDALFGWLGAALANGAAVPPLPESLAARSFRWTGGGDGPEPPVEDAPA